MITEGYLLRHCNGKAVFRDAALIDITHKNPWLSPEAAVSVPLPIHGRYPYFSV
jgi:hypothetical protein